MDSQLRRGLGDPPLYAQIADLLRAQILDGLEPGDRLTGEPALAEELGVSRMTVAKALELLARDGLIERRQGLGTFVTRPAIARRLPELTSFSEHITELGLEAGQRFVDYRQVTVEPGTRDGLLAAFPLETDLVVARRVRLVDALPAGLHRTALPAKLAMRIGFTENALRAANVSLYRLLTQHGIALSTAEEQLRARNATEEEAALLSISPGEALMHVRRLSRDEQGALIEAVDAAYVGSLYDYRVDLVRSDPHQPRNRGKQVEPRDQATHPDAGGGSFVDRRLRS